MFLKIIMILSLSYICSYPQLSNSTSYELKNNNIILIINNNGTFLNEETGIQAGYYKNIPFLHTGGFLLTGITDGEMWANAMAPSLRIIDYLPGRIGSDPNDPVNKLYILKKYDEPFGSTWQDWKNAVELGAEFYDGDNDGIYNPVDKNNNGKWDGNEDRPPLLGDEMVWCVYNDGEHSSRRRYNNIEPQGIEIQQSLFYVYSSGNISNIVFIRYRIINRGLKSDFIDSVYFSIFTDPDVGVYTDDLVGCDTLRNSGYAYSANIDSFGIPISFHSVMLQSPYTFIPGKSFDDINGNGIFDKGIDIPLDTAFNFKGYNGIDTIIGAKHIWITSFSHSFLTAGPIVNDPFVASSARYILQGKGVYGEYFDPCTWTFGEVRGGVDCSDVDPKFMYSGDPVTGIGWINTGPFDQRMFLNTGPFFLRKDEPMDIIAAYLIGEAEVPISSIINGRYIQNFAEAFYRKNFYIEIPERGKEEEIIPGSIILYQNYPNPFNPGTTINYSIDKKSFVTIRVYNLIGEIITELINEEKEAGNYIVDFNPDKLGLNIPSGIYAVRLKAGIPVRTIKMIYLK